MTNIHLNNPQTCATMDVVTLPITTYTELLQRVERLEKIILKRRDIAIIELGAVEDAFGIARTKDKRVK